MTAEELLKSYAAGERDFSGIDLHGVDLSNAVLIGINYDWVNKRSPRSTLETYLSFLT